MTRKDFEKFAWSFARIVARHSNTEYTLYGVYDLIYAFCDTCKQINPRFDAERFMAQIEKDAENFPAEG